MIFVIIWIICPFNRHEMMKSIQFREIWGLLIFDDIKKDFFYLILFRIHWATVPWYFLHPIKKGSKEDKEKVWLEKTKIRHNDGRETKQKLGFFKYVSIFWVIDLSYLEKSMLSLWFCIRRERTLSDESSLRSWQRESQWRQLLIS